MVQIVGQPFSNSGIRRHTRTATVMARPRMDFAPVLPPTSTVTSRNAPRMRTMAILRSCSYTVAL